MWILILLVLTGTAMAQSATRVDSDKYTVSKVEAHSIANDQAECDRLTAQAKSTQDAANSTCGYVDSVKKQAVPVSVSEERSINVP